MFMQTRINHLVPLLLIAVLGVCDAVRPGEVKACFYTPYDFKVSDAKQSDLKLIFDGTYDEEQKKRDPHFFHEELASLEATADSKKDDLDFQDHLAYVTYRTGKLRQAEAMWVSLLQRDPNRFPTLCNYGTYCELVGRYDDATTMIAKAAMLRKDVRSGAEELHLKKLEFLRKLRADNKSGEKHLWLDELTPQWLPRTAPPLKFKDYTPPDNLQQGLIELLRQFPKYGEAWLVLGMLLENESKFDRARLCYMKARGSGTSQAVVLNGYLKLFAPYSAEMDSTKSTGRNLLWLFLACVGAFAIYKAWLMGKDVFQDVQRAKEEKKAAEERKKKMGRR
ncbi:MAG: hypothetical protein K1X53_05905 [Candidatus Sumerlaeaceae bacterium]|nr:hypothetical protein [Candidatus Sumerlaeaceae bacterium]